MKYTLEIICQLLNLFFGFIAHINVVFSIPPCQFMSVMYLYVCAKQFARYLRLHLHKTDEAREVINKALEANPKNVKLYLQMLGRYPVQGEGSEGEWMAMAYKVLDVVDGQFYRS
jgi:hypothetical protein